MIRLYFVPDVFDELDVQRVMHEDYYVHRWFMHVFDDPGDQVETCLKALIKALKWRKDESVRGKNLSIYIKGNAGRLKKCPPKLESCPLGDD